jgi:GTP diphosphokinase / guanosine-3',5'-bis(diphosphate) 3'-diphosphatase
MARSSPDLPRMQNQARNRAPAPLDRALNLIPQDADKATKTRKPQQMMRQYELIERVRQYNPNADEALLNRAYVYAMKAHGEQKRAPAIRIFPIPSKWRRF